VSGASQARSHPNNGVDDTPRLLDRYPCCPVGEALVARIGAHIVAPPRHHRLRADLGAGERDRSRSGSRPARRSRLPWFVRHKTATSARRSRAAGLGTAARVFPSWRCGTLAERWDVSELVGGRRSLGVAGCMSRLLRTAEGQCAPRRSAAVLWRERQLAAVGVTRSLMDGSVSSAGLLALVSVAVPGMLRRGIGSEAGWALCPGRAALGSAGSR